MTSSRQPEGAKGKAELKLRAERKLGTLLKETVRHTGGQPAKRLHDETVLPDGISYTQSHRWQTIADLPEEEFEGYVAEVKGRQCARHYY